MLCTIVDTYGRYAGGGGEVIFFAAYFVPDLNLHTARKFASPSLRGWQKQVKELFFFNISGF